jgi:EmrB/QacA subfamily drug resistance transporter
VATIEWVVTVYLLMISGLLLSFGRLGDMRGHKMIYLFGFVIFVLSSAMAGLSPAAGVLIACRGVQALGGAMLLANAPAILTKSFPAAQRGQALGMQATMTYLGLTVGPSLGGWLTSAFSWRAVFYINVPVGLAATWLSWRFITRDTPADRAERFDVAGGVAFMAGLVALLLGLNQGGAWGWRSPAVLGLLTGAVVLLSVFVLIERRVREPMLDLSLFERRLFSASTASAVVNYICLYSTTFLMPFYLIDGRGFSPAHAGLILTAQPVVMAITAPVSGTLSDRIGSRLPGTLGMAILSGGLFLLSRLGSQSPMSFVAAGLGITGLGIGIFISPNTSALLGSAPLQRRGIASGILATARNVGMVLGVGLAGAIFTTVLTQGQASQPGGVSVLGSSEALFHAIDAALLAAAGVGLVGVVTSAVRGS